MGLGQTKLNLQILWRPLSKPIYLCIFYKTKSSNRGLVKWYIN